MRRPSTALGRASICTFCSLRALSSARLSLGCRRVDQPGQQRSFITTPRLSTGAATTTSTTPIAITPIATTPIATTHPSPYSAHENSFAALSSAVYSRLLSPSSTTSTTSTTTGSTKPIPESEVLAALNAFRAYARNRLRCSTSAAAATAAAVAVNTPGGGSVPYIPHRSPPPSTSISALLSLNSNRPVSKSPHARPGAAARAEAEAEAGAGAGAGVKGAAGTAVTAATSAENEGQFSDLTALTYDLLSHAGVFLTPKILSSFVALQRLTQDTSPIPAVFALYASKPILLTDGSGSTKMPKPSQAKYAIPADTAAVGLQVAIDAGDMAGALDIVDTSFARPAFQRNKAIRQALPLASVAALTPPALWAAAQQLSALQNMLERDVAAKYLFTGLCVYVGFTAAMGLLAVVTRNDQMVRVRWVPGTPLRERWLREEERAALDAIAMAWGFQDPVRRGEEEGEEWELLREVVGRKGMILDDPALMDGME